MSTTDQSAAISLSDRLSLLFRVWHRPEGAESSSADVAAAVTSSGVALDAATVDALRSGELATASPTVLAAISSFFKTPANYLTDPDPRDVHEQLLLLGKFRDTGVRSIHLRGERTAADRRALLEVLGDQDGDQATGV
ncbi:hypothetical protein Rwratislav_22537 [Rhodococcus wratislaviensis IFP 2016]|uniref:hypothetical protein n=1 Tax=Rhodococcus opacus TaxID=37919 RepID=UPI0002A1E0D7|nr:hypothetical protein [Rhodococcus opacus]ELB90785.1 hypothetical protein Rwratislav_22537 [Rhodococcus wratislaviensis IFP 2016]CAG7636937.1 Nucleoid-associated protein EspR [Rhodococcus opacus]